MKHFALDQKPKSWNMTVLPQTKERRQTSMHHPTSTFQLCGVYYRPWNSKDRRLRQSTFVPCNGRIIPKMALQVKAVSRTVLDSHDRVQEESEHKPLRSKWPEVVPALDCEGLKVSSISVLGALPGPQKHVK